MSTTLFAAFGVFALATLSLALCRLAIMRFKGDDCLHLLETDAPFVAHQQVTARRLDRVDAWGKAFTVLAVAAGVAAYAAWWFRA